VKSFGLLGGLFGADPTIVAGKCVDDNDHGTQVAGTVAALANNGKGVAGVALNSRLSICKGAELVGQRPDLGRGQLHPLGRAAGREGDLDVARRRA
jgi:hypothetical protein